jgi:hypothetical protein
VPVVADDRGNLAVASGPVFTSPPGRPAVDEVARGDRDHRLSRELTGSIREFFAAYGQGRQSAVEAFSATDVGLSALPAQARLDELTALRVYQGGRQRTAVATVAWQLAQPADGDGDPLRVTQRYALTLRREHQRWLVAGVRPAAQVHPADPQSAQ